MKMIGGVADGAGQRGGERQPPFLPVAPDELLEAGLVDRHLARPQRPDLRGILVDADHVVAALGEACARNQPDIPSPYNCNPHSTPLDGRQQRCLISRASPVAGGQSAEAIIPTADADSRRLPPGPPRAHGCGRVRARDRPRLLRVARRRRSRSSRAHGRIGRIQAFAGEIAGARVSDHRVPVRVLNALWHRASWPPVEVACGPSGRGPRVPSAPDSRARAAQVVTVNDLFFLDQSRRRA